MFVKSPADELAEIRAEIQRLKAREAELREAWLTDADMPKIGRWNKVELVTHRQNIFDPRLLPDDIRHNPAYTREKVTRTLTLRKKSALGPMDTPKTTTTQSAKPAAPRARLFAGMRAH
ncbi:hypothetical protein BFP70_15735 [Thioclava sp. SK-1]|uniref:hypothetical protein n=1 Tax=Thioclava sp. SK-1 TaxID=1889770 RepID=UPI000826B527|nr:hypothetical protein [Thioclava sp. SK-1]OCX60924.1 hypothetical protein BFP70_15735 [Thioclava sp. SK-1]